MPTTLLELLLLLSSQCYIHIQEFFSVIKETQIAKFQQAPLCRICEPLILPGDKLFCEDICGFFGDDCLLLCPTRSKIKVRFEAVLGGVLNSVYNLQFQFLFFTSQL
jgi:hypothetical protein